MAAEKKKKTKAAEEDQSRRFIDTAKALEADESGSVFHRAFNAVVRNKKTKK